MVVMISGNGKQVMLEVGMLEHKDEQRRAENDAGVRVYVKVS